MSIKGIKRGGVGQKKMDTIIGEFTIISGSDPSTFHTTFARSVRLEEGYQLGIKSLYHGPVKNLVYNKFKLHDGYAIQELELTPRFYSGPSDILLDMHQAIANVAPAPTLFEKDGRMKMVMPEGFWIEVNEAMFLNQNFKYVTKDTNRKKRSERKKKPAKDPFARMNQRINDIELTLNGRYEGTVEVGLVKAFEKLSSDVGIMESKVRNITSLGEWRQTEEVKQKFVEVVEDVRVLSEKFDALSYDDDFQDKVTSISSDVLVVYIGRLHTTFLGEDELG